MKRLPFCLIAPFVMAFVAAGWLAFVQPCFAQAPVGGYQGGGYPASGYNQDATLTAKVTAAIAADPALKDDRIAVTALQGVVQLNGVVGTKEEEAEATRVAHLTEGVQSVNNMLTIGRVDSK
ncbi:MAG: BON domain-containing protein [Pseudomonadota bacterium]|nr:BON domain-containing protein [Pseudomonadota bacterium]